MNQVQVSLRKLAVTLALVGTIALPASADIGAYTRQGRSRLSLTAGYGSINSNDYFVLGGGYGYNLFNGLEAGIDGEAWLGSDPHLYTLSPGLRYIFTLGRFNPYVGGFYKRTFYDNIDDVNSGGGRVGLIIPLNERTFLSGGAVIEHLFDCDERLYSDCTQVYPEFAISFAL